MTRRIPKGAPPHLLVEFGQLPRYDYRPTGTDTIRQFCEVLGDAGWRREQDGGPVVGGDRLHSSHPFTGAPWQETLKDKAITAEPGYRQRAGHRTRPWDNRYRRPNFIGQAHRAHPRVGDRWHAGVADESDGLASAQPLSELAEALLLVADEEGAELGADPESLHELPGAARVLGEDDVCPLQRAAQARRNVLEIADRRRTQDEGALHTGEDGRTVSRAPWGGAGVDNGSSSTQ